MSNKQHKHPLHQVQCETALLRIEIVLCLTMSSQHFFMIKDRIINPTNNSEIMFWLLLSKTQCYINVTKSATKSQCYTYVTRQNGQAIKEQIWDQNPKRKVCVKLFSYLGLFNFLLKKAAASIKWQKKHVHA